MYTEVHKVTQNYSEINREKWQSGIRRTGWNKKKLERKDEEERKNLLFCD